MPPALPTTLLALVQAISDYASTDAEIVATVAWLINSGTVRLCGTFAGARIELTDPGDNARRSSGPPLGC